MDFHCMGQNAIRPLSQKELKRILEIEWSKENLWSRNEYPPSGEVLFVNIQRTLPELLWIRGDMIILRQDFESFGQLWSRCHHDRGCTDKCIANICLDKIYNFFERSTEETRTNSLDGYSGGALFKYAARYWMEHYYLASPDLFLENASFRLLLSEKPQFDANAWAQSLALTYWSPGVSEDLRDKASPQNLEQVFGLRLLESAHISYRIVTSLEDNFDHVLLGVAREIVAEPKYHNMVQVISKGHSKGHGSEILTRFIATAPDEQIAQFFIAHDTFPREKYLRMHLTSIAVGGISAMEYLLVLTSVVPPENTQARGYSYLGTPLQIACEYGDSEVVAKILDLNNPWFSLEQSFPWNALHFACTRPWATSSASLAT